LRARPKRRFSIAADTRIMVFPVMPRAA